MHKHVLHLMLFLLICSSGIAQTYSRNTPVVQSVWTPEIVSQLGNGISSSLTQGDGSGIDKYFRNSGVVVKDGFYYAINGVHPVKRNNYTSYYPKSLVKASITGDKEHMRCPYYGSSSKTPSLVGGALISHDVDMEALTFGPDGGDVYLYVGDEYNYIYQVRLSDCSITKQWNLADIGVTARVDKGIEALTYSTETGYFYAGIQDTAEIHEIKLKELDTCANPNQCNLRLINSFSTQYSPSGLFFYPEQSLLYVFAGTMTNGDQYLDAYTTEGLRKCAVTIPQAVGISRGDGFFY